jgi:hypothetical protein
VLHACLLQLCCQIVLPTPPWRPCAAGVPLTNGLTHCPTYANSTSCYLLNTTQDTYAAHKSNCARMGGYLVSYNSAFEQLDVETQLKGLSPDSTVNEWYYIGLEKAGNVWYWLDGRSRSRPPPQCTTWHCAAAQCQIA